MSNYQVLDADVVKWRDVLVLSIVEDEHPVAARIPIYEAIPGIFDSCYCWAY